MTFKNQLLTLFFLSSSGLAYAQTPPVVNAPPHRQEKGTIGMTCVSPSGVTVTLPMSSSPQDREKQNELFAAFESCFNEIELARQQREVEANDNVFGTYSTIRQFMDMFRWGRQSCP